jgi:hypothetical protein
VSERGPVKSVHEGTSEESIVNEVWRLADGQGLNAMLMAFQMEVTRRNNVALREFKASADTWSKRLVALTAVLVVLTAALIAIAIESAYLAWVLIERGG